MKKEEEIIQKYWQEVDRKIDSNLKELYKSCRRSEEVTEVYSRYLCHKVLLSAFSEFEDPVFTKITVKYLLAASKCESAQQILLLATQMYHREYVPAKQALEEKQKEEASSKKIVKMSKVRM